MTKMKDHYATREEMERDQGRIMMERMKEREGQPKHKPVEVTNWHYDPKKPKTKKK